VTLDNVDDYLAPSQACVNPAFQPSNELGAGDKKDAMVEEAKVSSSAHVVVPRRRRRIVRKKIINTTDPDLPGTDASPKAKSSTTILSLSQSQPVSKKSEQEEKKKIVKASMADCLACSGCVTTAETVMMEEKHSLKSLRKRLTSNEGGDRRRVVTLSPNSWADLGRHWNLDSKRQSPSYRGVEDKKEENICPCDNDDDKLQNFYLSRFTRLLSEILSVKIVVDGNVPLQWAWIGEAQEFCQVYEKSRERVIIGDEQVKIDPPPLPSMAIDSSKTLYYKKDGTSEIIENSNGPSPILPLLSGSCPALVCLVEKSLAKLVPHLSQGVSPMSLVGTILKDNNTDGNDTSTNGDSMDISTDSDNGNTTTNNSSWDHWAIMPCHDKKLEASRKDFARKENPAEQAVDLVISTQECVELVEEWILNQRQENNDRIQIQQELSSKFSIANYLASLLPSDVSTTILEPNDLLQKSLCATDTSPLLVTTPLILRDDTTYSKTNAKQKQMAFSSGGHANYIFHYAAKKLFGCALENDDGVQRVEWKAASLATKNVRSARLGKLLKQHYYEAKLYRYLDGSYGTTQAPSRCESDEKSSAVVLHFAIAHGMQTMQRALKQVEQKPIRNSEKNSTLHYLEAMACPHGCVNGGGSVRTSTSTDTLASTSASLIRETPTETKQRVQSTLEYLEVPPVDYKKAVTARLPRTGYHVVPPMSYTTGAVAGVKVENMVW
jgi:iron only hydrogenase large subunit-like protein